MRHARIVLAAFVALFAILTLVDRFVLLELFVRRSGLPLLLATAEGLAIIAWGALARGSRRADPALDFVLGYPLFGTLMFVASLIGGVGTWLMAFVVALAAAGVWMLVRPLPLRGRGTARDSAQGEGLSPHVAAGSIPSPDASRPPSPASGRGLVPIAIVLACAFVYAQAPPASLDETAYHLAVPKLWALEGRPVDLPLLSHSYFPLGIESADLPLFALLGNDGGVASHWLHWFAAIATTLLIFRATRSWLATAAIVTTPALAITAGWSLVDWPLLGICVAFVLSVRNGEDRAAVTATAAGLLTKYTFLPIAIVVWAVARKWKLALLGLAGGAAFFVRNVILTRNPFAPFFAGDTPHVSGFREPTLASYVFEGAFVDESLGASLLAMAAGATGATPLLLLAGALALFFLGPSSRILVPFLAIPAMSATPLLERRWFRVLVAIAVALQTFFVVWLTEQSGAFGLLAGRVDEEQYLRAQRPSYADIRNVDALLPADSRTLVVGIGETYWFSKRVRGGGNFDGPRLSRYLALPTPEALRERLRRDGITHVAVLPPRVATRDARKAEERSLRLDAPAQRMLAQTLDRYTSQLTRRGDVVVFTLK